MTQQPHHQPCFLGSFVASRLLEVGQEGHRWEFSFALGNRPPRMEAAMDLLHHGYVVGRNPICQICLHSLSSQGAFCGRRSTWAASGHLQVQERVCIWGEMRNQLSDGCALLNQGWGHSTACLFYSSRIPRRRMFSKLDWGIPDNLWRPPGLWWRPNKMSCFGNSFDWDRSLTGQAAWNCGQRLCSLTAADGSSRLFIWSHICERSSRTWAFVTLFGVACWRFGVAVFAECFGDTVSFGSSRAEKKFTRSPFCWEIQAATVETKADGSGIAPGKVSEKGTGDGLSSGTPSYSTTCLRMSSLKSMTYTWDESCKVWIPPESSSSQRTASINLEGPTSELASSPDSDWIKTSSEIIPRGRHKSKPPVLGITGTA